MHARLIVLPVLLVAVPLGAAPPAPEDAARRPRFTATPEQIEDRVVFGLARSPSLAGSNVEVSVVEGTVTLVGEVPSETARRDAIDVARRATGVADVRDELRVVPPERRPEPSTPRADAALAAQIAERLADRTFPDATAHATAGAGRAVLGRSWQLDVAVERGQVTLDGHLVDRHQLRRAVDELRAMPGVRSVDVSNVRLTARGVHGGPYPPAPPPAAR